MGPVWEREYTCRVFSLVDDVARDKMPLNNYSAFPHPGALNVPETLFAEKQVMRVCYALWYFLERDGFDRARRLPTRSQCVCWFFLRTAKDLL